MKKILYIDLDNVLVDFPSAFLKMEKAVLDAHKDKDDIPGIFSLMEPVEESIESFELLSKAFDVYILSTSPWNNPSAWSDKLEWVKKHLGQSAYKRLILSHHKNLNKGDYLIDDRTKNGASEFEGELIQFGSEKFPDWKSVTKYLLGLKDYKVTAQPAVGDRASIQFIVRATNQEEAKMLGLKRLIAEESDDALLDSPGQILTAEEMQ